MNKYCLELTEAQLDALIFILDRFSRISIGQVQELKEMTNWKPKNYDKARYDETIIKNILFPELDGNSFYGIFGDKTPENAKIAFDIYQVIRHRLAWDRAGNPKEKTNEMHCKVSYDTPMQASKNCNLPVIYKCRDDVNFDDIDVTHV